MDQLKKILKNIVDYWGNMTKRKKIIIISSLIGVVIVSVILTLVLNRGEGYIVLYEDISSEETVEILQQLQESNVDYKYERNGKILIPVEQESVLRMQLAQAGHPKTGINYDTFTGNINFMTTDYEKKTYELFQLQERLQGSIETIREVADSVVTLNIPERDKFSWESDKSKPTASIKLTLKTGEELTEAQVDGIIQLASKSVEGLAEEDIAILDSGGNSLIPNKNISQTDTVKLRLELEKQIADETVKNVSRIVTGIYGEENVRISARVKINFDKKISEMLQYIPEGDSDKGVLENSKKDVEITGPGETTGGVVGAEANAELPRYPGVTIQGDDIYFSDSESMNYLVSELKEQIEYESGNLESLTVAVAINKGNMTEDEEDSIKELIAFSAGVDVENVSLQGLRFYEEDTDIEEPIREEPIREEPEPKFEITEELLIIGAIAFGVLLIIIIVIVIIVRKKRRKKRELKEAELRLLRKEETENELTIQDLYDEMKNKGSKEVQTLGQIKEFSNNNPETVSQLIRNWMRGDD